MAHSYVSGFLFMSISHVKGACLRKKQDHNARHAADVGIWKEIHRANSLNITVSPCHF